MLITGGGAFNTFLIERLKSLTKTTIVIPNKSIINYKEALVFALLGYLKNEGKNNCLKSVTGAQKNHSSGVIFTP
jgi:anhydro-N-acetylmuramic acid kinase